MRTVFWRCFAERMVDDDIMMFNKSLNRFETPHDHIYVPFNYRGFQYAKEKPNKARIKCRLIHQQGSSVIIPDFIFLKNGWIQPLQFTAPILAKIDDDTILANFFVDIQNGETIKITISKSQLIRTYPDRSQMFECEIYGPRDLEEYISGRYATLDNDILLFLYHHTNDTAYQAITKSRSLRTSRWNYRGSKECVNFSFVYFTHIPEIKFPSDLSTIAMSQEGKLDYMIDSFVPPEVLPESYRQVYKEQIYVANVYRATTSDRNKVIEFVVSVECIDIKHTYMHHQGAAIFYETCFPYIHRLKTQKDGLISFDEKRRIRNSEPIVHATYSVIGDARTKDGLAAPFEEEETTSIFKIEDCGSMSIPAFWFAHGNADLFSGKRIDPMTMNDVADNPTN